MQNKKNYDASRSMIDNSAYRTNASLSTYCTNNKGSTFQEQNSQQRDLFKLQHYSKIITMVLTIVCMASLVALIAALISFKVLLLGCCVLITSTSLLIHWFRTTDGLVSFTPTCIDEFLTSNTWSLLDIIQRLMGKGTIGFYFSRLCLLLVYGPFTDDELLVLLEGCHPRVISLLTTRGLINLFPTRFQKLYDSRHPPSSKTTTEDIASIKTHVPDDSFSSSSHSIGTLESPISGSYETPDPATHELPLNPFPHLPRFFEDKKLLCSEKRIPSYDLSANRVISSNHYVKSSLGDVDLAPSHTDSTKLPSKILDIGNQKPSLFYFNTVTTNLDSGQIIKTLSGQDKSQKIHSMKSSILFPDERLQKAITFLSSQSPLSCRFSRIMSFHHDKFDRTEDGPIQPVTPTNSGMHNTSHFNERLAAHVKTADWKQCQYWEEKSRKCVLLPLLIRVTVIRLLRDNKFVDSIVTCLKQKLFQMSLIVTIWSLLKLNPSVRRQQIVMYPFHESLVFIENALTRCIWYQLILFECIYLQIKRATKRLPSASTVIGAALSLYFWIILYVCKPKSKSIVPPKPYECSFSVASDTSDSSQHLLSTQHVSPIPDPKSSEYPLSLSQFSEFQWNLEPLEQTARRSIEEILSPRIPPHINSIKREFSNFCSRHFMPWKHPQDRPK